VLRARRHGRPASTRHLRGHRSVVVRRLGGGREKLFEAGRAGRTADSQIVVEDTDALGVRGCLEEYPADDVAAVFRRGPAEDGVYTWIPQSAEGRWWSY